MKINKYFIALLLIGLLGNSFDQVQAGVFNKVALSTCAYLGVIGALNIADNMKIDAYTVSHPVTNYQKDANKKIPKLQGQHFFKPSLQENMNCPIMHVQTSKLIDKGIFFDNRKERIRKIFEKARSIAPCFILSDHINGVSSLNFEENELQIYLLQEVMDAKKSGHTIFIDERFIDAFNVSDDNKSEMHVLKNESDLSDDAIHEYLEKMFQHIKFSNNIDVCTVYDLIIEFYAGQTISWINCLQFMNEAQHIALQDNSVSIDLKHLHQAMADQKDNSQWIEKLRKLVYGNDELTMHHEAGHALLTMKKNTGRSAAFVTVIPRRCYQGMVALRENYHDITQNDLQLEHDIMMYLAGGVCEQIFGFSTKKIFNDMDAGFLDLLGRHGPSSDIDRARERARLLIKDKDKLDEIIINQKVELILKDCYMKTFNYILEHKSDIICIVDLLREKGIISSIELQALLDNK